MNNNTEELAKELYYFTAYTAGSFSSPQPWEELPEDVKDLYRERWEQKINAKE